MNDPVLTLSNVWIWCSWQFDGQCSILSVQSKAEAGSVPSCASVAVPVKSIWSPTDHVSEASGSEMVGTGALFPAEIVLNEVSVWPSLSVTFRPTLTFPTSVNVWSMVAPVPSSNWPSPSRSQAQPTTVPLLSVDPLPSKWTASGAVPLDGVAVKLADGGEPGA